MKIRVLKFAVALLPVSAVILTFAPYRGSATPTRLHYITTAHQAGPVGFRDPFGAVSPDGVWLAYISNRHLFLHRIEGSWTTELPPADDRKAGLRWFPDSMHIAVMEASFSRNPRWFRYDISTRKREPLESPPIPAPEETKPRSVSDCGISALRRSGYECRCSWCSSALHGRRP